MRIRYTRWLVLMFVCATMLSCAARKSMKRGDQLMAAGNYDAAYNAYLEAANRRPNNDKFVARLEEARVAVLQQSLADAEAAIEARDYFAAKDLLDKADAFAGEGNSPGQPLRQRAREYHEEDARAALADKAYWDAYDLALSSGQLWGYDNDLIAQIRTATIGEGKRLLAAKDYPRAWDLFRIVKEFEPNMASEVQTFIAHAEQRWVSELQAEADRHAKKKERGMQALFIATADAINGEMSGAWRNLAVDLRKEHDVRFSWKANGPSDVIAPTRNALADVFGLSAGKPDVTITTSVQKRCSNQSSVRTDSKNYLAGTRMVPNPQKKQLANQLDQEDALLARELEQLARAKQEYERASANASPIIQQHNQLVERKRQLQTERDAAARQLEQDRYYLEDTRRKYEQMKAQSDGTSQGLMTWEKLVWEAESKVQSSEHRVESIDDKIRQLDYEIERINADDAEARVQQAEQNFNTELREAENQEARVNEVRSSYDAEPAEIEEEIWDTLRYPVKILTRTCEVTAISQAKGGVKRKKRMQAQAVTTDEAHAPYPVADVPLNPMQLPRSDANLFNEASQQVAAQVRDMTSAWAADAYANALRPSGDVNADVERWVGICQARADMLTREAESTVIEAARAKVKGFDTVAGSGEHSLKAICL